MSKFLIIVLVLAVGGAIYMRMQQPKDWNNLLDSLKVPGVAGASGVSGAAETTADGSATPPPSKPAPVYINSSTATYTHSSHIIDVPQPNQVSHARVFVPPNPLPAQSAWVWTTTDGRTFRNVMIEKVEADQVTIFHDQGSAVVDIALLPSDIQTKLNYDPELASQAKSARQVAAQNAADASIAPATSSPAPQAPAANH